MKDGCKFAGAAPVLEPVVAGDGVEDAGNGMLLNRALAGAIQGTRVVRAQ